MFCARSFSPSSANLYFSMPNENGYRRSTLSCTATCMSISEIFRSPFFLMSIILATFRMVGSCVSVRSEPEILSTALSDDMSKSILGKMSIEPARRAPTCPCRFVITGIISFTCGNDMRKSSIFTFENPKSSARFNFSISRLEYSMFRYAVPKSVLAVKESTENAPSFIATEVRAS